MENEKSTNFFEIFAIIKGYWIKLRLWFFISLLSGIILAFVFYKKETNKPLQYMGTTTFMLSSDDVSGGAGLSTAMGILLPSSGGGGNKTILLELLKSHSMIERTLLTNAYINGDSELLINHYIKINGFRDAWKGDKNWENYSYTSNYKRDTSEEKDGFLRNSAINIGASYTPLKSDEGIFSISFIHTNQEFTKAFIDNLVITLINYYTEKKTAKSRIIYEYAKNRYDALTGKVSGQEQSLAKLQDQSGEFVFMADRVPQQSVQRDIGLSSGMLQEAAKSLAAASMSLVQETPFVQVIDDVRLPLAIIEPSKVKKGIIGFALGFLGIFALSGGIILGLDFLRKQKEIYKNEQRK